MESRRSEAGPVGDIFRAFSDGFSPSATGIKEAGPRVLFFVLFFEKIMEINIVLHSNTTCPEMLQNHKLETCPVPELQYRSDLDNSKAFGHTKHPHATV